MSFGARRDFVEVVSLAQLDDDVRVLVITGTGRGFLAGVNNNSTVAEEPTTVPGRPPAAHAAVNLYAQLVHYAQDPVRAIRRLDKLTIAAVNGYTIQLGLSIVLACDFAVAARSAQLGSATLRMGWQPDEGGHWLLVEHLGVKRALDFLMRKRMVSWRGSVRARSRERGRRRRRAARSCHSSSPPSWRTGRRWRCAC